MSMKCLIVDDEPLSRDVIRNYIQDHPDLELAVECKDAFEAMGALEQSAIDLIFLDINMPKLSGINFYKSLNQKPMVIFTTAYPEFAVEGFELDAVDYLLKPFSFERFIKAVNKAKGKMPASEKETSDFIMLKADKKMYRTAYEDILFFESLGDYVKVYTKERVLIIAGTLKKLLADLPESQFLRTHKSYIISMSGVEYIEGNQIKIGEHMVSIGQAYREEVLNRLKQ